LRNDHTLEIIVEPTISLEKMTAAVLRLESAVDMIIAIRPTKRRPAIPTEAWCSTMCGKTSSIAKLLFWVLIRIAIHIMKSNKTKHIKAEYRKACRTWYTFFAIAALWKIGGEKAGMRERGIRVNKVHRLVDAVDINALILKSGVVFNMQSTESKSFVLFHITNASMGIKVPKVKNWKISVNVTALTPQKQSKQ
jgi:hypothetical protein